MISKNTQLQIHFKIVSLNIFIIYIKYIIYIGRYIAYIYVYINIPYMCILQILHYIYYIHA